MRYSIKITREDLDLLNKALVKYTPRENAIFLLAGKNSNKDSVDFTVRRLVEIPDSEFRVREKSRLEISPRAINGIIALCEANKLGLIICHSHPKLLIHDYSPSDDFGERRIVDVFHSCLLDYPIASLLLSDHGYRGRYWGFKSKPKLINRIKVIGRCIENIELSERKPHEYVDVELYDRHVLAFGELGQAKIAKTKVGIVGVGGTGSAVAEQLVRLGVKDFVIIDKDYFDSSNLTRVYGSFYRDISSVLTKKIKWLRYKKVNLIKEHLYNIKKGIKINPIFGNIVTTEVCSALLDRDIIFSCTDDQWGRSILNQIAYQYLIPVINIGVRIDSIDKKIRGGTGSLHVLRPGKPCLWCYEYLKADIIYSESMLKKERDKLLKEGYVKGVETKTPSVISLTSTMASLAVTIFLQMVTDFMGQNGDISSLRYDIMEGDVRRCTVQSPNDCICKKVLGLGDFKTLNTYKRKDFIRIFENDK
jgi:molybdopterin/thiamine biosynthesis adenylyltransferase